MSDQNKDYSKIIIKHSIMSVLNCFREIMILKSYMESWLKEVSK